MLWDRAAARVHRVPPFFWEGHVNRIDVMQQFGISVNQASSNLYRYITLAPDNVVYDKSARTYVRGPDFDCEFRRPYGAHYLTQLRLVADDVLERGRALLYYALRRLGPHTDPAARRPQDQQIVLLNREAVTGGDNNAFGVHRLGVICRMQAVRCIDRKSK